MANRNMQRLRRKYLVQRRTRIDEVKMRDLNSEAHKRANAEPSALLGFYPRDHANLVRVWVGLNPSDVRASREEVLVKLNSGIHHCKCLVSTVFTRLFLVWERGDFYYFLYRDLKLKYYKRSITYGSETRAMLYYKADSITWINLVSELP